MKKIILYIVCLVCIVCCLSACSNKEEVVQPTITESEETTNVLEFKGEYLKEYKNMEVPEVRKFLGTAVVNIRTK